MATPRPRLPPPPPLTTRQQEDVVTYDSIAVRVAAQNARKKPPGLPDDDVLAEARAGLAVAIARGNPSNPGFAGYLWERVRGAVKDLFRRTRRALRGRASSPADAQEERLALGASTAIGDYGAALQDPGNLFHDTPADSMAHFTDLLENGAAALATGASAAAWHTRGEPGFVWRAETVRTSKELHDLVSELPPKFGAVIDLRYFQELPIEEVMQRTHLSESTVGRRLAEGYKLLRARLAAREITGPPANDAG
jgi:RNA polymerase sigma factor (sigma-70 family)